MSDRTIHDVVICGGGLAGLTLACQLRRELPDLSVVVIDRLARPLPEAAFKVGEATVEVGGFYLSRIVGLESHLDRHQLVKHGLRFFFGDGTGPVEDRPEFGLSGDPPSPSYLIDRGRLENHLWERVETEGVELREGRKVVRIHLGKGGAPHEIALAREAGDEEERIRARWVVDASGRRRLIQRTMKLARDRQARCSAAWFRVESRVSVRDLVPPAAEEWHHSVPPRNRDLTVCHLVGRGYWVWIIPLPSDATSIGIVVDEKYQPFEDLHDAKSAVTWLERHEPALARRVAGLPWLDFRVLRRYSYKASQVLSADRWGCTGEAAFFSDPLNSPGTDIIGFTNCILVDSIRRELGGELDPREIAWHNAFLCGLNELLTYQFQLEYGIFGHPVAAAAKIIWNVASAWSIYSAQMFNQTFLEGEKREAFRRATMGYFFLTRRMQALFRDWGTRDPGRLHFDLIDYQRIRLLRDLARRNLRTGKSAAEIEADQRWNMERLEELAQALFLLAVEDVLPEHRERFREPVWLNPWKVSLDPAAWERDGVFAPATAPRDAATIHDDLRALFVAPQMADAR
jgi:flavin-dependent dehydrogenase